MIDQLTRRVFHHVEPGLNTPSNRLDDIRAIYAAEDDLAKKRNQIKGSANQGVRELEDSNEGGRPRFFGLYSRLDVTDYIHVIVPLQPVIVIYTNQGSLYFPKIFQ